MTESVTNGITPNEIVIPARDVKGGDVLVLPAWGGGEIEQVVSESMLHHLSPVMRLLTFQIRTPVLRFNDELVRVRRPVPTVTIKVELTQDEVEVYPDKWSPEVDEAFQSVYRKVCDAIRAARAKETTP